MTFHVRDAGNVLVEIGASFIRDPSNVLVEVSEEAIRDVSGVHTYFAPGGPFTVDVTPDSFGGRLSPGPGAVTTSEVVATPTGGTAPYSYLWTRTDADPSVWQILSPTAAATQFRAEGVGPEDTLTATFKCTVTDSLGATADSADVNAQAINYGTPI